MNSNQAISESDIFVSSGSRRIDRSSVRQKQLTGLAGGLLINLPLAAAIAGFAHVLYFSGSPLSYLMAIVSGDYDPFWFWGVFGRIDRPITATIVIAGFAIGLVTAGVVSVPALSIRSFRTLHVQVATTAAVLVSVAAIVSGVSTWTAAVRWTGIGDLPPTSVVILIAASAAFPAVLCVRLFRSVFSRFSGWTFGVHAFQRDRLSIRAIMILTVLVGLELVLLQSLPLELVPALAIGIATVFLPLFSAFFLRRHVGSRTWLNFAVALAFGGLAALPWLFELEPLNAGHVAMLSLYAGLIIGLRIVSGWLRDVGWGRVDYRRGDEAATES